MASVVLASQSDTQTQTPGHSFGGNYLRLFVCSHRESRAICNDAAVCIGRIHLGTYGRAGSCRGGVHGNTEEAGFPKSRHDLATSSIWGGTRGIPVRRGE